METIVHQRRSSGNRNDKAWNWLPMITPLDDYTRDDEYITSVAATAFAIHSLEEAELRNLKEMRARSKSSRPQAMRREENYISKRPSYGETSTKSSSGQDPRTKETAFPVRPPMPVSPALGYQRQQQGIPFQHKNAKTRPETCEKAMIKMIQKQFEKIKSKILSWEFVQNLQAQVEGEMEMQNNQNKVAREDMIVQGARAGLEDRRRKESEARKKTNTNRKASRVPVKCLCFNS